MLEKHMRHLYEHIGVFYEMSTDTAYNYYSLMIMHENTMNVNENQLGSTNIEVKHMSIHEHP